MCDPLVKAAAAGQALLPVFANYTNTIAAPILGGPVGYKYNNHIHLPPSYIS